MFEDQGCHSLHENETEDKLNSCKTCEMECGVNSPYYQMQSDYLKNNIGLVPRPHPSFPSVYSETGSGLYFAGMESQQSLGKSSKEYLCDTSQGMDINMVGRFETKDCTPMPETSLEKGDASKGEAKPVSQRSRSVKQVKKKSDTKCEICGDSVQSGPEKGINMLKCATCLKLFKQMRSFYDTVSNKRATKEKLFSCEVCEKNFVSSATLKTHMIVHSGEKSWQCPCCDKKFFYEGNLKTHMRTHTGEKPFVCDTCGKSFSQSGTLKKHIRVHTGEKPYKCEFCDKTFAYSENLIPHRRTHSGEKPFHCHVCDKSFTQPGSLRIHLRSHSPRASRPETSNGGDLPTEGPSGETTLLL